ncbi:phosphoribosylformylglycinamidine cyclo-ligase [Miltoncostaea marina]|uniref:phosphoribosylformylglycinamidine cyclo-ligase n=1 Tax=Miltoncostaea marina TaxID=2843215 RepID=UPI001C3CA0E5|nr:phosphoribosylformylglycinamidine cyclo-ligase [Miltoncostaea marina]
MSEPEISYRDAGVDLDAAARHTAAIAAMVAGGQTGFAAAHALPAGMREPVLVTCTDGIGTKLLLAQQLGRLEGLGQDLVAMCVNDMACTGARPLVFLDYLAVGRLDTDAAALLVRSIADACAAVGCALAGGETAEMPGLYAPGHFDLAGFAAGVVERADMLGPHRVREGDAIIGLPSSGLHSNGYSLVRALVEAGALAPDPDLLLAPTRLYTRDVERALAAGVELRSAAHITGGGLPENLPRALPEGLGAVLREGSWEPNPAMRAVLGTGRVADEEAWATFNMGLGMCLVVAPGSAGAALTALGEAGAVRVGTVEAGAGVRRA